MNRQLKKLCREFPDHKLFPSQRRTILYNTEFFHLSFPSILFCFHNKQDTYASELFSFFVFNKCVRYAILPNFNFMVVCLGRKFHDLNSAIKLFWSQGFNDSVGYCVPGSRWDRWPNFLSDWQDRSLNKAWVPDEDFFDSYCKIIPKL